MGEIGALQPPKSGCTSLSDTLNLYTLCILAGGEEGGRGGASLGPTSQAQQIQCLQKSEPGKAGQAYASGHLSPA